MPELHVRLSDKDFDDLCRLASREDRNLTSMVRVLIRIHCRDLGIHMPGDSRPALTVAHSANKGLRPK